jgi:DNA polymerase I-like protein with 3'-5' exonuclease and polymerase domains
MSTHGYQFVRTPDPVYVSTVEEANKWAARYAACESVAFDTETTGLSKTNARVKFFSFSDGTSRIAAPVEFLDVFAPILQNPEIEKRMSNAKFDMHMVANHGILIQGHIVDTVHMSWHYDENRMGQHGLKECSKEFLGLRMAPFTEVFGKLGRKNDEVAAVCLFHDVIWEQDHEKAAEILVTLKRAAGDEGVMDSLKKLALARMGGNPLTVKKMLAMARLHGLIEKSTVKKYAYVVEAFDLLGVPIEVADYARAEKELEANESAIASEMAHVLQYALMKNIQVDNDPLDMLTLSVADYASLDAWASFELSNILREELAAIDEGEGRNTLERYELVAAPFLRVLWNCERRGFAVDLDQINAHAVQMKKDIEGIERKVVKLTKDPNVNLSSPIQLRKLFYTQNSTGWFDPFGEAPTRWTSGGESGEKLPSTDAETLEGWAERGNFLAKEIIAHRELSKLEGTYFSGLPQWVDFRNRIHTDLKAHGARTGRLSSGDPNLQNIPAKGEWGRVIRKLFIAGFWGDCDPAWCMPEVADIPVPVLPDDTPMTLIVADYDQLEVKIAAHVSGDEVLIETLRQGLDVHSKTSASLTGIPYEDFIAAKKADNPTPAQEQLIDIRSGNKSALFGIFYGIGAGKLGTQLGKPIIRTKQRNGKIRETCPEAQAIIDGVFAVYPGLKQAIDATHDECAVKLYVQTITGRFRRLPDIISDDRGVASQAERQAFNSRIQGSAADVAQAAMLKCERDPYLREVGARMLLQIHDELVFEVPDIPEYVTAAKERIKFLMEHPFDEELSVPLTVSLHAAKTWGEAK